MAEISEEKYQRIAEGVHKLPSFPSIVTQLMTVIKSPRTSADDAARLIEKDPSLTGRVLRIANSAFYGMPRTISSVSSAVVILGFNTIRSIVFSASLIGGFPKNKGRTIFDRQRFWQHSIVCGQAAKMLAKTCFQPWAVDPETAFCAGIIHDIGKLVLEHSLYDDFMQACTFALDNGIPLVEAEKEHLGITHSEIGTILFDRWSLPLALEYALVFHHNPDSADKEIELVNTISSADFMTHDIGMGVWEEEKTALERDSIISRLGLSEESYDNYINILRNSINTSSEFVSMAYSGK